MLLIRTRSDNLLPMLSRVLKDTKPILFRPSRIQKMSLFPRNPIFWWMRHDFAPISHMFNEMQRVSISLSYDIFSPKFDVKEDKETYILECQLLGVDQEDITIEFRDDHNLTIRGRTEHSRDDGQRSDSALAGRQSGGSTCAQVGRTARQHTDWVSERSVRYFARGFTLPIRIDQAKVKASLSIGVLSVVLPKLAQQNS